MDRAKAGIIFMPLDLCGGSIAALLVQDGQNLVRFRLHLLAVDSNWP